MDAWQLVALLGFVILVYAWVFMRKKDAEDYSAVMSDVEDTMEHFAVEAEERNEKLIAHLTKLKEDYQEQMHTLQARLERLEERTEMLLAGIGTAATEHASFTEPELTQANNEEPGHYDAGEAISQRYSKLIALKKQGLTIDDIVKQTGMNHGEIELILQLASREESKIE